jgi:hypothetical protein
MNFQRSDIRRQRSELNSQPSVELQIEELVLHGFPPSDRYLIGEAVEQELTQLIGEQGIPGSLRVEKALHEIRGAIFSSMPNEKPHAIGRQIAQAVYRGFSQPVAAGGDRGLNGQGVEAVYQARSQ